MADFSFNWTTAPIACFDIESTGTNVDEARIVTASIVWINPDGGTTDSVTWLANPGVEIPAEATEIHGITTEHAREHGQPAFDVCWDVNDTLRATWEAGCPIVAFNACYDFTVLDRELRRHHGEELKIAGPVLDPFVIDKAVDRYRKAGRGGRRLQPVCQHYGVPLDDAHNSAADAEAAGRLMLAIAKRYPDEVGEVSLRELWKAQVRAYREQATSLEQYKRDMAARDGASPAEVAAIVIEREWPLRKVIHGGVRL